MRPPALLRAALAGATLLALGLTAPIVKADDTGFLDRHVGVDGVAYKYQVFVPTTWTPSSRLPVVLFLHGAGERGDDGVLQTTAGMPSAIRAAAANFPAIVVMPQCRKDMCWSDPAMEAMVLRALDEALREWNGDPTRVYLTGLSLGGYGAYFLAWKHPDLFAAVAPVCGGISRLAQAGAATPFPAEHEKDPYDAVAAKIGATPIWIFHGAKDDRVPVAESRRMVKALEARHAPVKYTEYPQAGHDSWTTAYKDPAFAKWLLAQRRPPVPRPRALAPDGLVRDWLVLEPAMYKPVWPPGAGELHRQPLAGEGRVRPHVGQVATVDGTTRTWKAVTSPSPALDVAAATGVGADAVSVFAYAVAYVRSDREISSAIVRIGAKDMVRVYFNGTEVLSATEVRPYAPDQIAARVSLKKGLNVLFIKSVNTEHSWHVAARIVDGSGAMLSGIGSATAPEDKAASTPLDAEGFVRSWLVLGPVTFKYPPLAKGQLASHQIANESALDPQAGDVTWLNGHALTWRPWRTEDGTINFNAAARLWKNAIGARHVDTHGGTLFNGIAWAVSYIDVAKERRGVELRLAVNDQGKIWINGAVVLTNDTPGTLQRPPVQARITLRQGRNVLLFKALNASARWEARVSLFEPGGGPLAAETGIEPPLPDFRVGQTAR